MTPEQRIQNLENELRALKDQFLSHQHDGVDGTNKLRKDLILDKDQFLTIGNTQQGSNLTGNGTSAETHYHILGIGADTQNSGFVNKSVNMQIVNQHAPNGTQSFHFGQRSPIVVYTEDTSISTTVGASSVTISGYNFSTNELADATLNILDSSGTLVESQTIFSNTATTINIYDTFLTTTTGGKFTIMRQVYSGSADNIWQRLYTSYGTAGGIRFGIGPTGHPQNGLLYMDSSGDLYWRPKGYITGDTTSRVDVTSPGGSTRRYTYDGTGTDPSIDATTFPIGAFVSIKSTSLASGNTGTFTVTGSGVNYFEVSNSSGSTESNKTFAGGYLAVSIPVKLN